MLKASVILRDLRHVFMSKDVDSALNWLRNKDDANLDPTSIFNQLDASLPKKPGQSLKERATEIANALNWIQLMTKRNPILCLQSLIPNHPPREVPLTARRKWKTPSRGSETRIEMSMTLFLIQMVF
jgi:hypothetical protein